MRKKLTWAALILVVLFLAAQLYQPDRTNPPVDDSQTIYASLNVPSEVKAIFERSCYDCHSNNTNWPWYSYIAPTSWLTASDVKTGRSNLNLSTWATYKKSRQINKLDQISDQLSDDKMPLKKYRLMHPNAALSKAEVDMVCAWAEKERDRLSGADSTGATEKK